MNRASSYFDTIDDQAEAFYDEEKYAEAVVVLESAYEEFPEQYFNITWRLLLCYRELGQFDKCLEVIESSLQKGYFFALQWKSWDPIRTVEDAEGILEKNEQLKAEAKKKARMRYVVHLPDDYTKSKPYPLFLTMHCDSGFFGNIELHKRNWKPDVMLKQGFIVIYVQSSQVLSYSGFGWEMDIEQSRKDIQQCYDEIATSYPVDTKNVILGGFSGGGLVSIDLALNSLFPVKGFVALSPDKPRDFSKEICEKATQSGVRGVIMEGELASVEPDIQEMETTFKAVGLPYELIINKGIGHWYPDDLPEKLERAITFILDN